MAMSEEEKREREAQIGFAIQEFFNSVPGAYLKKLYEERIAITLSEMAFAKKKMEDKTKVYLCQTIGDFERHRGYAQGLQAAIDIPESLINVAKRRERERKEQNT